MEGNSSPSGERSEERGSEDNEGGKGDKEQSTVRVEPQHHEERRGEKGSANDMVEKNQSPENDGAPQVKMTSEGDSVGDGENSASEEARDDWPSVAPEKENHKDGGGEEEEGGEGAKGSEEEGGVKEDETVTHVTEEEKREGANLEWGGEEEEEEEEVSETDEEEVEDGEQESDEEASTRRRRRGRGGEDSAESEESEGETTEPGTGSNVWKEGGEVEDDWKEEEKTESLNHPNGEGKGTEEEGKEEDGEASPMFVPTKGKFFQHDDRAHAEEEENQWRDVDQMQSRADVERWQHDMYKEEEQGPREKWQKERDARYYASFEKRRGGRRRAQMGDYFQPSEFSGRGGRGGRGRQRGEPRPDEVTSDGHTQNQSRGWKPRGRRGRGGWGGRAGKETEEQEGDWGREEEEEEAGRGRPSQRMKEKKERGRGGKREERGGRKKRETTEEVPSSIAWGEEEDNTRESETQTKSVETVRSQPSPAREAASEQKSFQSRTFSLTQDKKLVVSSASKNPSPRGRGRGRGRGWKEKADNAKVGTSQMNTDKKSTEESAPSKDGGSAEQFADAQPERESASTVAAEDASLSQAAQTQVPKPKRYSSQRQQQKSEKQQRTLDPSGQDVEHPPIPKDHTSWDPPPGNAGPYQDPSIKLVQFPPPPQMMGAPPHNIPIPAAPPSQPVQPVDMQQLQLQMQMLYQQNPATYQQMQQFFWMQSVAAMQAQQLQQQQQQQPGPATGYISRPFNAGDFNFPVQQPGFAVHGQKQDGGGMEFVGGSPGLFIPPVTQLPVVEEEGNRKPRSKNRSQAIPIVPPKE